MVLDFNDTSGFSFERFLGDLSLDKSGKVKVDPNTGAFIPRDFRRSKKNVKQNPLNINAGNAIDPNVDFAQVVLAKSNQGFGEDDDLLRRAGFGG